MTYTPSKLLSFEEFIALYGDNTRYELIDGELRDIEPTGPHETVVGSIAGRIYLEIFCSNFNWLVPETCLIKSLYTALTALRPDVVVLDKAELGSKPLWPKKPVICKDSINKLVAEIVITSWQDNYAKKSGKIRFF
jgi:Uma2 family endonuclease